MSELRLVSLVSLVCLGLAACNDDDEDGKDELSSEPLTAGELCELYKSANYAGELQCSQSTEGIVFDDGESEDLCAANGFGTRYVEALLDSVESNRLTIDWKKARQCNVDARALRTATPSPIALVNSADWLALRSTGACGTFFTANANTGDACVYLWDCKNPNDYCTSDAPYGAEPLTCRTRGAVGDTCNANFKPCAKDLLCSSGGTCVAETLPCIDNSSCAPGRSCVAGACINPDTIEIGAVCNDGSNCKGECTVCNQHAAEVTTTCKLRGGEGSPCELGNDCADDLGCTGGVCTTVAEGADCGLEEECARGLRCTAQAACNGLNETDCNANAPACEYRDSFCTMRIGKCTLPPSSGSCLPTYAGSRCARDTVCVTSDSTCRPYAELSQPCDDDSVTAPACADGLECVAGTCVASCGGNTDCDSGQYCDTAATPNVCKPVVTTNCTSDAECGDNKICPETALVCATHLDQPTCAADVDCSWNGASCVPGAAPQRRCVDRRKPGEVTFGDCAVDSNNAPLGQNQSCESGFCYDNGSTLDTCIIVPRGCLNVGAVETIALPFLFGMVRALRRRKK